MRRALVAGFSALTVLIAPLAAAAAPTPSGDAGATASATVADSTSTDGAPVQDEGGSLDDQPDPQAPAGQDGGIAPPSQRHGFTEDPAAAEQAAEAQVVAGQSTLPAPQPGAEVFPRPASGVFDVVGGGFGHRIGMSQYGADGAGKAGLTYRQILAHYYPGTQLETRSYSTVKVGITIDHDGVTRVAQRPGLRVSSGVGAATNPLPTDRTEWRVRATSGAASSCVLEGRTGSGWSAHWPAGMTKACPVTFSSTEGTVDLYLPDSSRRVYRGAITATHTGSTSLATVNALPMQHYLRSVVGAEMPHTFHPEGLKSQAVAARTYAARRAAGTAHYDTCDTTWCQVYKGMGARTSSGGVSTYEYASTTAAVDATNNQVLTYRFPSGVQLATTMYTSSSGGYTAPAGNGHHYMPAQSDPYDSVAGNARHSWKAQLPATSLQSRYGIHRVERVQILRRDGHGRWGGRVLDARVEGFTANGTYTWAYASGSGLMLARQWPTWSSGLSSDYFTIVGSQPAQAERIAGDNRYGTAEQVARAWSSGVPVTYVVSGLDYPDALAAAARAGVYDAPVLLTKPDGIPAETDRALRALRPQRVVVVGGPMAVSGTVLERLRTYTTSGSVQRVSGENRYGTAAEMASFYPANRPRVLLASGENFPDALAGAALAGHQQVPLLLTRQDRLDPATVAELKRLKAGEVVVLGGSTVISEAVAKQAATHSGGSYRRLAGSTRYGTSAEVARQFPAGASPAYVASGQAFPDALVGAALAGRRGVPMVLTRPERVDPSTAAALEHQRPSRMYVLGGPTVIPKSTLTALSAYLR